MTTPDRELERSAAENERLRGIATNIDQITESFNMTVVQERDELKREVRRLRAMEPSEITADACPDCGGQCAPECGRHPAGCIYGGFSYGYWIIAEGCPLYHGEQDR